MGYGGTMSDWGLTLLHRLAQHREIIIFDNPAQVGGGSRAGVGRVDLGFAGNAHCAQRHPQAATVLPASHTPTGCMASLLHPHAQGLSEEMKPGDAPLTPEGLEEVRPRAAPLRARSERWRRPYSPLSPTTNITSPCPPHPLLQSTLAFISSLNLTRMHVAGWSLGACAALKLAAFHPDRVSKVGVPVIS